MEYLTTGELSRRLGVARRTIQDWRRQRLITPALVTAGGQARWVEADVREQLRKLDQQRVEELEQQERNELDRAEGRETDGE